MWRAFACKMRAKASHLRRWPVVGGSNADRTAIGAAA